MVTLADRNLLFVQDAGRALRVETLGDHNAEVGDRVELVGFPQAAGQKLVSLVQAQVLSRRSVEAVSAKPISDEQFQDSALESVLISVSGILIKRGSTLQGEELTLQLGQQTIATVVVPSRVATQHLPIGSVVEATGVRYSGDELQNWLGHRPGLQVRAPAVLVRHARDLRAIERPGWWRLRRALLVIGGLAAALVAGAFWVYALRRRIRERTLQLQRAMDRLKGETELSATLSERNRLAAEIHDSLQQSFSGLLLQLDGATRLPTCSAEIRENLQRAKGMIKFSMSEVRHAVWDLHSPILEKMDLASALERIVGFTDTEGVHITIKTSGVVRHLPPKLENHLLRIGQEGIANAVKHARASQIDVRLEYEPESVTLSVQDNGVGFDTNLHREQGGHFGLRGLRSRARKLGGTLTLRSCQGEGTILSIHVRTTSQDTPLQPHA